MTSQNDCDLPLLFYNYKQNMDLTIKTQRVKKQLLAITAVSEDQYHGEHLVLCPVLPTAGRNHGALFPSFLPQEQLDFPQQAQGGLNNTHASREAGRGVREVSSLPSLHMGVSSTG